MGMMCYPVSPWSGIQMMKDHTSLFSPWKYHTNDKVRAVTTFIEFQQPQCYVNCSLMSELKNRKKGTWKLYKTYLK